MIWKLILSFLLFGVSAVLSILKERFFDFDIDYNFVSIFFNTARKLALFGQLLSPIVSHKNVFV